MAKKEIKETSATAARREQVRTDKRNESLFWNSIVLGTLGFTLLLVVFYIIANQRPGPLPNEQLIPDEGRAKIAEGTQLTFQTYPPSSGTHYDRPLAWGVYTTTLLEGNYVNNLARGGVVFLYQCDGETDCAITEGHFQDLVKVAPADPQFNRVKIVAGRYERDLPTPIVALAWGHQLNLDTYDEATLLLWYRRFMNQGPEALP